MIQLISARHRFSQLGMWDILKRLNVLFRKLIDNRWRKLHVKSRRWLKTSHNKAVHQGQGLRLTSPPVPMCKRKSDDLSLYHNCDSTTKRLRYDDTTTHLTTTKVIEITICVRFDCDTTTTKNWHVHFLLASNRLERKQARSISRSRIVVVVESQL